MKQEVSSYIPNLESWQYEVSGRFTLRGHYTPPSGKPVIHFLHGNGFNGLVYEKFLAPLTEHFDLFLSNAQGHGDSDVGNGFSDWDDSASYFSEVWQRYSVLWEGVRKIGLGHSFGGVNTLLMSRLDRIAFDRIIMLDPIIGPKAWSFAANTLQTLGLSKYLPLAKQALARGTEWDSYESLWKYFYQRGTFKGWDDDCLRSYLNYALSANQDGSYSLKCPPEIEARVFASYSKDVWSALNELDIRADALSGDRTYSFVRHNMPKLEREYPTLVTYSQPGGHCFMQERPEESANTILKLLQSD